jgi:dihydroorotate dehydrogenase electron transfer subunit
MKCGLGLCGSCVIDEIGSRVCEEGPVFDYNKVLSKTGEFSVYHRNETGIIEYF